MNTLPVMLLAVVVLAVAGVIVLWRSSSARAEEVRKLNELVRAKDDQAGKEHDELVVLRETKEHLETKLRDEEERHRVQMEDLEERHRVQMEDERTRLNAQIADERNQHEAQMKREQERLVEISRQYESDRTTMADTVARLAAEELERKRKSLGDTNKDQIDAIVKSVNDKITELNASVLANKTTLETQVENLIKETGKTRSSADSLAMAITTKPKAQGDWGEVQLENCLRRCGAEYKMQETLRDENGQVILNDESGSRMRPDAMIYLDAEHFLVVDAKTSVKDYVAYTNAKTEPEREASLGAHVESVKKHYLELAKKSYHEYDHDGRSTVDFVLMFVPIEGALQLFLDSKDGREMWYDAMSKGVYIVGEQNLYAAMRVVAMMWQRRKQEENWQKIFEEVNTLLSRLGLMSDRFKELQGVVNTLNTKCTSLDKSLTGNQSVVSQARKIVELGGKEDAKHPLPKCTQPGLDEAANATDPETKPEAEQ